jgi:hypothetical protein
MQFISQSEKHPCSQSNSQSVIHAVNQPVSQTFMQSGSQSNILAVNQPVSQLIQHADITHIPLIVSSERCRNTTTMQVTTEL